MNQVYINENDLKVEFLNFNLSEYDLFLRCKGLPGSLYKG